MQVRYFRHSQTGKIRNASCMHTHKNNTLQSTVTVQSLHPDHPKKDPQFRAGKRRRMSLMDFLFDSRRVNGRVSMSRDGCGPPYQNELGPEPVEAPSNGSPLHPLPTVTSIASATSAWESLGSWQAERSVPISGRRTSLRSAHPAWLPTHDNSTGSSILIDC